MELLPEGQASERQHLLAPHLQQTRLMQASRVTQASQSEAEPGELQTEEEFAWLYDSWLGKIALCNCSVRNVQRYIVSREWLVWPDATLQQVSSFCRQWCSWKLATTVLRRSILVQHG